MPLGFDRIRFSTLLHFLCRRFKYTNTVQYIGIIEVMQDDPNWKRCELLPKHLTLYKQAMGQIWITEDDPLLIG